MKFKGTTEEYLYLTTNDTESFNIFTESVENGLTILWFTQSNQNKLIIDGHEFVFSKNEIRVFLLSKAPFLVMSDSRIESRKELVWQVKEGFLCC